MSQFMRPGGRSVTGAFEAALVASLVGCGWLGGCIGDARDARDSSVETDTLSGDTVTSDTASDDTSDTAPDSVPDTRDTADGSDDTLTAQDLDVVSEDSGDTADSADTRPPQCRTNGDCEPALGAAGQCKAWYCDGGVCLMQTLSGGSCDDDDPCTTSDFCEEGVCTSGGTLRCDRLSPDCWSGAATACTPGVGCVGTYQPEGQTCSDATGPRGGECAQGWLVPNDTCDGGGLCVDKSALVPPGVPPLAANWHVVISSAESGRPHYTARFNLNFGASGGLTMTNPVSTSAVWTAAAALNNGQNPNVATYCAALEGEVVMRYAALEYHGRTDPNRRFMVFHGPRAELGVAVRQGGNPASVNGVYRLVTTAQFGFLGDRLMVWQGNIGFNNGCVSDTGGFSTTPGLGDSYTFDKGESYCLTADGSNFRLPLRIRTNDGEHFDIQWFGTIGPTGDVLLMTRDDGSQLRYGTILLLRQRDAASVGSTAGSWDFVGQRGGVRTSQDLASSSLLEFGRFELGTSTLELSGTSRRDDGVATAVGGVWWFPGAGGRYSQRYSLGDALINHTGWISESSNVIVGWRANDPEVDANTPQNLSLVPYEGSLLVAVRWTPFARPFR